MVRCGAPIRPVQEPELSARDTRTRPGHTETGAAERRQRQEGKRLEAQTKTDLRKGGILHKARRTVPSPKQHDSSKHFPITGPGASQSPRQKGPLSLLLLSSSCLVTWPVVPRAQRSDLHTSRGTASLQAR